jgi:organic radical activating enzyme
MHITNENLDCCILTLFVHNVCNFSCRYCNDYHRDGSNRWPTDWQPYLDLIEQIKKRNKYVYVEVLGGEPTVWPKFQEFVDTISEENVFVEYATNASRSLRYWKSFKTQRAFVFLSWHSEEIDDDHFVEVARIMQDKASVSIPLMIIPDNFERSKILYNRLTEFKVEITPKFTRTSIDGTSYFNYTDEQREWITNNSWNKMKPLGINWKIPQNLHFDGQPMRFMNVLDKGLHKFEGYTCTAGIRRLMVEPDGNIKRCTKGVGGSLGNIKTGNYSLPDTPIVCDYRACPCKLDAVVEKWV